VANLKFIPLSLGVVVALLMPAADSSGQLSSTGSQSVVQLRIEVQKEKEALATAVLVHREDGARGVVLFFLSAESVLRPASIRSPGWEPEEEASRGDDPMLNIAVIRVVIEKSALVPAAVALDPPGEGELFFVVAYNAAGSPIVVAQRARTVSVRSALGDLEMPSTAGCVGAPAFTEKGVVGIVSECRAGQPPQITLLSAASRLLRRLIPGLDLGPEESQTVGIGN
jgi:hypothetical protein